MNLLFVLILFTFIGGFASLLGGMAMLVWQQQLMRYIKQLTGFAAGVLLSLSIIDLLPESFREGDTRLVALWVLAGILFLMLLEKTSLWFFGHEHEHDHEEITHEHHPEILGIIIGDSIHNFMDGVAIAAALTVNINAGLITAFGVALHELPHEVADFSLYMRAGFRKQVIFGLNLISSFATLVGALAVYFLGQFTGGHEVYVLAGTAGMFIYISLADLLPDLDMGRKNKYLYRNPLVYFLLGVFAVYLAVVFLG